MKAVSTEHKLKKIGRRGQQTMMYRVMAALALDGYIRSFLIFGHAARDWGWFSAPQRLRDVRRLYGLNLVCRPDPYFVNGRVWRLSRADQLRARELVRDADARAIVEEATHGTT